MLRASADGFFDMPPSAANTLAFAFDEKDFERYFRFHSPKLSTIDAGMTYR